MSQIKYWWSFGRRVWLSLGIGWSGLAIALSPLIRFDQAGAILVCGAIVAEVLHDKRHRLFVDQIQPGIKTFYSYKEIEVLGEDRKDIIITVNQNSLGETKVNTKTRALYHLAKPSEFSAAATDREWFMEQTMDRLEKTLDYAVVVSAISGTLLWAFA